MKDNGRGKFLWLHQVIGIRMYKNILCYCIPNLHRLEHQGSQCGRLLASVIQLYLFD